MALTRAGMTVLKTPVPSYLEIPLSLFFSLKIDYSHILLLSPCCNYDRVGKVVITFISQVRNAAWLSD